MDNDEQKIKNRTKNDVAFAQGLMFLICIFGIAAILARIGILKTSTDIQWFVLGAFTVGCMFWNYITE